MKCGLTGGTWCTFFLLLILLLLFNYLSVPLITTSVDHLLGCKVAERIGFGVVFIFLKRKHLHDMAVTDLLNKICNKLIFLHDTFCLAIIKTVVIHQLVILSAVAL